MLVELLQILGRNPVLEDRLAAGPLHVVLVYEILLDLERVPWPTPLALTFQSRAIAEGYGLVGGIGEYENTWRMAYVRGPEGLVVPLSERVS